MEECDCTVAALKENEIQLENARFEQDQVLLLLLLLLLLLFSSLSFYYYYLILYR